MIRFDNKRFGPDQLAPEMFDRQFALSNLSALTLKAAVKWGTS